MPSPEMHILSHLSYDPKVSRKLLKLYVKGKGHKKQG